MTRFRALLCFVVLLLGAPRTVWAHFSENFESGTMAHLYGECWRFQGASVSGVSPLSGNFSARTSVLSANTDRVVGGPWVSLDGFDELSFRHRVDALGDGPLTIEVVLINPAGQVTPLFGQTYAVTTTKVTAIPLPMTGIYRVEFRFAGDGGTARAYLDNVAFPAEEFSDLTTNDGMGRCMPLECSSSLDCVGKGSRTLCDFASHRCVECRAVNDCEDLDPCTADRCVMNRCESTLLCGSTDGGTADGGSDGGEVIPGDGGADGGPTVMSDASTVSDAGRDGAPDDGGKYITGKPDASHGRWAGSGCGLVAGAPDRGFLAGVMGVLALAWLVARGKRGARGPHP